MGAKRKPYVGAAVQFIPAGLAGARGPCAAIITSILDDKRVTLCGLFVLDPQFNATSWEDTVPEGTGPRTWRWPPEIEEKEKPK